jgi:dephospho-CoA kinase
VAPLRIGLTGGIGSGKSTVAAMFAKRGACVIDSDAISRRLTAAGGAAMPALRGAFGNSVVAPDGALDRDAMRSLVFSDPAARQRLEAVLHPQIAAETERQAAMATSAVIVFDIPLLAESRDARARVDRVLVVDCSAATQTARVIQRPGWTRDAAERAIASQASREARRAIADAVIFNDGIDLAALDAAVAHVWQRWQPSAQDPVEQ